MDWEESVQEKLIHLREDQVLIITGSLYFLAEVKPKLLAYLGAT
jgi:dihydrofolate synthase/folylpolyglutamate synthase